MCFLGVYWGKAYKGESASKFYTAHEFRNLAKGFVCQFGIHQGSFYCVSEVCLVVRFYTGRILFSLSISKQLFNLCATD